MKTNVMLAIMLLTAVLLSSCAATHTSVESEDTTKYVVAEKITAETKEEKEELTVIIDPGHGFRDPGSTPEYLSMPECDITLKAAKQLKALLEERNINTILTHDGDKYTDEDKLSSMAYTYGIEFDSERVSADNKFSPYERSMYENILSKQYPNCFFISIHTNSIDGYPEVRGASLDWYEGNPFSRDLRKFADKLSSELRTQLGTDLKIFEDSYDEAYIVTKYANIPSVLIELGYGSNPYDAENLENEKWLRKFMSVVADALVSTQEN